MGGACKKGTCDVSHMPYDVRLYAFELFSYRSREKSPKFFLNIPRLVGCLLIEIKYQIVLKSPYFNQRAFWQFPNIVSNRFYLMVRFRQQVPDVCFSNVNMQADACIYIYDDLGDKVGGSVAICDKCPYDYKRA
jgi:hypothetical protein